jgi:MoxR-like ATPase
MIHSVQTSTQHDAVQRLRGQIAGVYYGSPRVVDELVRCLLAGGHALLEGVPGVGKTLLASALARSIDGRFNRVQMTPDMLPSDVLGVSVYQRETGRFEFRQGPIFANVLLADEINRTTPRTQTALLEAMNEASVSIDGHVFELEKPFMVVATQNPYEFEGTFLLPENQLDRFLVRIAVDYPEADREVELLDKRPATTLLSGLRAVVTTEDVRAMQGRVDGVRIAEAVRRYIVDIARATRAHPDVQVGLSPRGSLALAQTARATAFMAGRDFVTPDDVLGCVRGVCAHRVITRDYAAGSGAEDAGRVMEEIVRGIKAPV